MALEVGKYISPDMAIYIEQWTEMSELKELAKKHELSDELARKLARGDRKITENNIALVTDIISKAIENRKNRLSQDKKLHPKALNLI